MENKEIEGMCSHCNQKVSGNEPFCLNCGFPVQHKNTYQKIKFWYTINPFIDAILALFVFFYVFFLGTRFNLNVGFIISLIVSVLIIISWNVFFASWVTRAITVLAIILTSLGSILSIHTGAIFIIGIILFGIRLLLGYPREIFKNSQMKYRLLNIEMKNNGSYSLDENSFLEAIVNHDSRKVSATLFNSEEDLLNKEYEGWSPLFLAIANDYSDMIKVILEKDSTVLTQKKEGMTPLIYAIYGERKQAVDVLLMNGADPLEEYQEGINAVQYSVLNKKEASLNSIMRHMKRGNKQPTFELYNLSTKFPFPLEEYNSKNKVNLQNFYLNLLKNSTTKWNDFLIKLFQNRIPAAEQESGYILGISINSNTYKQSKNDYVEEHVYSPTLKSPEDIYNQLMQYAKNNKTGRYSFPISSNSIDCPECHSKGYVRCLECGGTGEQECSGCNGSGEEDEKCPKCNHGKIKCTNPKCLDGNLYRYECRDLDCVDGIKTYYIIQECSCEKLIDCPNCNGTGKFSNDIDCRTCHATGKYCEQCQNTGKKRVISEQGPCPQCTGGIVYKRDKYGDICKCPECNGTSYIDCNNCNGKGSIKKTCSQCKGSKVENCKECEGSGNVQCEKCQGIGEIYNVTMRDYSIDENEVGQRLGIKLPELSLIDIRFNDYLLYKRQTNKTFLFESIGQVNYLSKEMAGSEPVAEKINNFLQTNSISTNLLVNRLYINPVKYDLVTVENESVILIDDCYPILMEQNSVVPAFTFENVKEDKEVQKGSFINSNNTITKPEKIIPTKGNPINKIGAAAIIILGLIGSTSLLFNSQGQTEHRNQAVAQSQVDAHDNTPTVSDSNSSSEDNNQSTLPASYEANSYGNIINSGYSALMGNSVIFAGNGRNSLSMLNPDGTQTGIANVSPLYINVSGDYIYYVDMNENGHIFKVKKDGSEKTQLNDENSQNLVVLGDWLYYIKSDTSAGPDSNVLKKIKTDGTSMGEVGINGIENFNIVNGKIYYQLLTQGKQLYTSNLDGTNAQLICDSVQKFLISGSSLYYIDSNKHTLNSLNLSNNQTDTILNDVEMFNVDNNNIYFTKADGNLYRSTMNGDGVTLIYQGRPVLYLCLSGDYIIFSAKDKIPVELLMIKKDGTNVHQL